MHNALGVFVYLGSYGVVAATAWTLYQQHLLDTWFVALVFLVATGLSHLITEVWPRQEFREAKLDVLFQAPIILLAYFNNHFWVRPIALALAWWITSQAPMSWGNEWAAAMKDTSPLVLILACLLFYEGTGYLQHRIFHAVPALWRISHSAHHEPQTFGPALAIRLHYIEYFTAQMTRLLFLNILQVDSQLLLIVVSVSAWGLVLIHANTSLRFGWINYIIATPETHIWHHDADKRSNYATGVFSIFDWIGGTFYYRPNQYPARLGISGVTKPRTVLDIVLCRSPNLDAPSVEPSSTPVKA